MRKIEQEMVEAIHYGSPMHKQNTAVTWEGNDPRRGTVSLHGNVIATVSSGTIHPWPETFRRFPTATTASRLRALGIDARIIGGRATINGKYI